MFTFGQNNYGQLAQGHTTHVWIPTEVLLDDVIDIEAGMYHCVFLTGKNRYRIRATSAICNIGVLILDYIRRW